MVWVLVDVINLADYSPILQVGVVVSQTLLSESKKVSHRRNSGEVLPLRVWE